MRVQIAKNFLQRSLGLMGRAQLERDSALCLPNCRQVHTAFMNFAIDAVFVDSALTVVGIETLRPWKISRRVPQAAACYELRAGEAVRRGICLGNTLQLN